MTNEQLRVAEWMQDFGQETPNKPTMPSEEVRKLRAALILEEALETIAALGFELSYGSNREIAYDLKLTPRDIGPLSLAEIADGLGDLHVVGYCGTGVACGIDMYDVFSEIMRSNFTKLWTDAEYTNYTAMSYIFKQVAQGHPGNPHLRIWLVKDSKGKVIKSPSYSPARFPWLEGIK